MRKLYVIILALFVTVGLLAGCDKLGLLNPKKSSKKPAVAVKGTVIAKVAHIPITLEMLNREIDAYNAEIEASGLTDQEKKEELIDTREKKLEYLNNFLVRRMVFYQAALDRGLERKEDIRDYLEGTKINFLAQAMQEEIAKNIDVSPTEIDEAYKLYKDQLKEPEERNIREIVVATKEEANQIYIELLQGADFDTVARARSIAKSKDAGGALGPMTKEKALKDKPAVFVETAFSPALGVNVLSSVFQGPEGFYIVKAESIKEGKQTTLAEAQDQLKALLMRAKILKELNDFYSKASRENIKVEVYESEIK